MVVVVDVVVSVSCFFPGLVYWFVCVRVRCVVLCCVVCCDHKSAEDWAYVL